MEEKWRFNGFYLRKQKKRWRREIPFRVSCRRYVNPPAIGPWTALSYAAARCCLMNVRIVLGACDERFFSPGILPVNWITGVTRFAAVVTDTRDENGKLYGGVSGEAFVLEAAAQGVSTCWVSGTYRKKECPVPVEEWEEVACVIALGQPQEAVSRDKPPVRKRKPLERICKNGPAGWPDWAREAAEAMRLAPSAMNQQPWELEYVGGVLALWGFERNSLDTGIALMHLETAIDKPHTWTLGQGKKAPAAWVKLNADSRREEGRA